MDTPRRMLIDYTQRGKYNSRQQGKQTATGSLTHQKKVSDSSTAACCAGASPLLPSQSPPACFESMTLSFTSIDSDKVEADDPAKLIGFEAISFFLTIPPDDHDNCCQRPVENSKDRRKWFQESRIAHTLSPRRRRNAVTMLWVSRVNTEGVGYYVRLTSQLLRMAAIAFYLLVLARVLNSITTDQNNKIEIVYYSNPMNLTERDLANTPSTSSSTFCIYVWENVASNQNISFY